MFSLYRFDDRESERVEIEASEKVLALTQKDR
jgi:hypothetical protein